MYSFDYAPPRITDAQIAETYDAEVVIVGAGIAAMVAAVKASELSDNVHIIEKGASYGSTCCASAACNSRVQREAGMEFDVDEMIGKFWGTSQGYQAELPLIALWFQRSGEFMDWLTDILAKRGFKTQAFGFLPGFKNPDAFFNSFSLIHLFGDPNPFEGGNPDWMGALEAEAKDNGAVFHYQHTGCQLVREDAGHGRVSAVIAKNAKGEYVRFNASKGVIMGAGDFLQDKEMCQKYCPEVLDIYNDFGNKNNYGDMHKAAMWIGAAMEEHGTADIFGGQTITGKNLRPNVPYYSHFMDWSWGPAYATLPTLFVDIAGRRCMNEEMQFVEAGYAIVTKPGHRIWSVWDEGWADKVGGMYPEYTPFSLNNVEQRELDIKEGLTVRADTIDELIDKMGVDPDIFKATLERYNALCDKGHDDDCLKDPHWMVKVDQGPFYASCLGSASEGTRVGLRIDRNINVLDTEGRPIPGLYAIGNTSGNFYGCVYPCNIAASGVGHGQCFGYLAAKHCITGSTE